VVAVAAAPVEEAATAAAVEATPVAAAVAVTPAVAATPVAVEATPARRTTRGRPVLPEVSAAARKSRLSDPDLSIPDQY
jgi:hypothetical protein